MALTQRKWSVKTPVVGRPQKENFEVVTQSLNDSLEDGEILVKTLFVSVDPYLRSMLSRPLTDVPAGQISEVVKSRDEAFPVGSLVRSNIGWTDCAIINPAKINAANPRGVNRCPELGGGLSPSLYLGACGMPGLTAYFGVTEILDPKPGETLIVNAASGAVGHVVGQIGKVKGCRVIGFAGDDAKVDWLKNELKFDFAFNYKKTKIEEALAIAAPNGVDCFYENVGNSDSYVIIKHMNEYGRIAVCGCISTYNATETVMVPSVLKELIGKQIKMQGFLFKQYAMKSPVGVEYLSKLLASGEIKTKETVVEGFDQIIDAFLGLFDGNNIGKMVVKM